MSYTEIQEKNGRRYYYRVMSVREGSQVRKKRKYIGVNLSKEELKRKELEADKLLKQSLNNLLTEKEKSELGRIKAVYIKQPKENLQNRYDAFLANFTYDSNAIEGNTLSLQETSFILFEGMTPKGKSLREINEVINHKKAFDFLLEHKEDINKAFICGLQGLVISNTLRKDLEPQTGKYRNIQVYIRGANFIPPKSADAAHEMRNLLFWYTRNKASIHPLILAAYFHTAFESIHPFVDGNGRTGRLLLNFILHKNNYPMINIPNSRKLRYYKCLEEARKGNLRKFVKFLYGLIMSTKIYI